MEVIVENDESLLDSISTGVSIVEERRLEELPSLYDTIDPEVLRKMRQELTDVNSSGRLSFSYSDSLITIEFTDEVRLKIRRNEPLLT